MDEFDEGLEKEVDEGTKSSRIGIMALSVAVIGIVVGVAGIFLGNQAQRKVDTLREELKAQPDKVPELVTSIDSLEERLERLGSEFVKLNRQDTQLRQSTQDGFSQIQRNVQENRSGINELGARLTELVEKLENWQPPRSSSSRVATASGDDPDEANDTQTESPPESGIHRIVSGDTLSKIASQYGVSLGELQRANPTVNPRALQIGQEIVIPQN